MKYAVCSLLNYLKNTIATTFNNVLRNLGKNVKYLCGSLKKNPLILIIRKFLIVIAAIGLWSAYFFQPVWMASQCSYIEVLSENTESYESDSSNDEESFELPEASWNEEDPVYTTKIGFVFNYKFLKSDSQLYKIQLSSFRSSLLEPPAMC